MNKKLRDIIRYIVKNYPYPDDLTKTRITKLVYLVDWENVRVSGDQITEINWYFDHYGPYVSSVLDEAEKDENICIEESISNFGTVKYIVKSRGDKEQLVYNNLSESDKEIINYVIEQTKELYWNQFIKFVYATEPIRRGEQYNFLNLNEYR